MNYMYFTFFKLETEPKASRLYCPVSGFGLEKVVVAAAAAAGEGACSSLNSRQT